MAVTDYMVVTGVSPDDLAVQIAAAVGDGWTPSSAGAFAMGERVCRELIQGSDQGITSLTDYTLVTALTPEELQNEVLAAMNDGYQIAATEPFLIGERLCRELIKGSGGGGGGGGGPVSNYAGAGMATSYPPGVVTLVDHSPVITNLPGLTFVTMVTGWTSTDTELFGFQYPGELSDPAGNDLVLLSLNVTVNQSGAGGGPIACAQNYLGSPSARNFNTATGDTAGNIIAQMVFSVTPSE